MRKLLQKVWDVLRPPSVETFLRWLRQLEKKKHHPEWVLCLCQCLAQVDSDQVDGLRPLSIESLIRAYGTDYSTILLPSEAEILELFGECAVPSVKLEQVQRVSSPLCSTQPPDLNISTCSMIAHGTPPRADAPGLKQSDLSSDPDILDEALDRRIFTTKMKTSEPRRNSISRTSSSIFLKKVILQEHY